MRRMLVLLAACVVSICTLAQDGSSPAGVWVAKFLGGNGSPREAKVVFAENGGTYKMSGRSNREDPCLSMEVPISISNATADTFDLTIHRSKSLAGCPDGKMSFKRTNATAYEGATENGRAVTLSKE